MASEQNNNLIKLKQSNLLSKFVKSHDGKWEHQNWLELLALLEQEGFTPIGSDQVGLLLEEEREIYLAKKTMQRHVEEEEGTGLFETVTGTFKNFFSSGQHEAHSSPDLASINNPHWLAKRDILYENAVSLIRTSLVSKPVEQRQETYFKIIVLLYQAIDANDKVQISMKQDNGDYMGEYFILLTNLLKAASSMANVDQALISAEADSISSFAGSKGTENLKNISVTCMEDEKKLHESIMNLIITVEDLLAKEELQARNNLNKSNQLRYDEALAELRSLYKKEHTY